MLKKLYNPNMFQGNLKKKNYFEGWYFKLISQDGQKFAFIPGISLADNDKHAFIQFIDGNNHTTKYIRYDIKDFKWNNDVFDIKVGNCHFNEYFMELDINSTDVQIKGKIEFNSLIKLKSTLFSPGIMGWYSFIPLMQCYHGILSLDHSLLGSLFINSDIIDFTEGNGYSEKDWGHSFPSSWIWLQSNNFNNRIKSFMFSLAKIPWLGSEFDGFLSLIVIDNKVIRFATYTNAVIENISEDDGYVLVSFSSKYYRVNVKAKREDAGLLKAPIKGEMSRNIHESLNSIIQLEIENLTTGEILEDTGIYAGCEFDGDIVENFAVKKKII